MELKMRMYAEHRSDLAVRAIALIASLLMIFVMLYPFVYIVAVSFSKNEYVTMGMVTWLPKGFNLNAYRVALSDPLIIRGYINTIFYTSAGTALSVGLTLLTAYPLAIKQFRGKKLFLIFLTFTMYFSGGLIPYYMLVQNLHMKDTLWALILPGVSVWYIIICRTFFQANIPIELRESALMDGANDLTILTRIYTPLSKPILATLSLWLIVGHWNSWFNAMLFIENQNLYPLQLVVRKVLITFEPTSHMRSIIAAYKPAGVSEQTVRSAIIVVTILPIVMIYPFLQKYFVKGIMIGAIKG
ncbi:carbohydrate ABC transporter permease [Paenibacillaceae bacterium WGS1546]|uniref:carbohydrate ABC transporter permease n=1 Tax=Cohnella sp. WGS1546 TaxID=3366810 RepID=UPI00372D8412